MSTISRLESLLYLISAEKNRTPTKEIEGIIIILKEYSERNSDSMIISMFKQILLELAVENGTKEDFKEFCLEVVSRVNQEFNIIIN